MQEALTADFSNEVLGARGGENDRMCYQFLHYPRIARRVSPRTTDHAKERWAAAGSSSWPLRAKRLGAIKGTISRRGQELRAA